ncbi:hypothetical protein QVD17_28101 [Tagetes erecta]|uniref:Cytochrome P450 n=1 Tax=Tagetes erecta TaxID=13708 RepID=A0AAD8KAF0_TARER|nr:hypothetical protein QVD17_28101 [Tagetes erecta]
MAVIDTVTSEYYLRPLIISLSILTLSTVIYRHHSNLTTLPLIGTIITFLRHRHRLHDHLTDTLATANSLTLTLRNRIFTVEPTNLEHILQSNFINYINTNHYTYVFHELLGTGAKNSDSGHWFAQRRIATRILDTQCMKTFVFDTLQLHVSKTLMPHLSSSANNIIDLQQLFRKFSFDMICNVALGLDLKSMDCYRYELFVEAFDDVVEHVSYRFTSLVPVVWKLKRYFNVGSERKYKEGIERVNEFVMDVIKLKETGKVCERGQDIVSMLMNIRYDVGYQGEEKRKLLRDNAISFILAGTYPTSTALTWFFWLLDGHPHCKQMIREEISMLTSLSRNVHQPNLTFDELKKLNYLRAALSESMRLFPPVPINSTTAVYDDILPNGTYVEQGWCVDYSAYAMARMKNLWGSDCREFKPERWLDADGVFRILPLSIYFKYIVFNGGDRVCLGKEMAMFQMMSVVVMVMHEFEIEVVGGGGTPEKMADPPYGLSIYLSMKNGLPVRVKKRESDHVPRAKDRGVLVGLFGMVLVGLSFYKHKQYLKLAL